MIARPPQSAAALAYGHEDDVAAGAPMTVGEGDQVVMAKFGTITRVIGPGSYQVPAEFAGAGVEAWFITSRPMVDVKFGSPINAGSVKAVFGTCTLRVVSAEALASNLLGQHPDVAEGIAKAATGKLVKAVREAAMKGADPAAAQEACLAAAAKVADSLGIAVEISAVTVT